MRRPALPRCCHAACPPLQSSPDPRENRVGGWAKKCARCCGCGAPLRFRVVLRLCKRRETMKVMRVAVSLGECCCFPSSRTLPLSASPRLPSLRHHAPLGSPQAPQQKNDLRDPQVHDQDARVLGACRRAYLAVQVAGLLGHDAWRAGEGLVGAWAAIWVEATPPRVNRLKLH